MNIIIIFTFVLLSATANSSLVSITYVFDTTASMGDVLRQARRETPQLFHSIETAEAGKDFNYILVPFDDPFVDQSVVTTSQWDFLVALKRIHVRGGLDCPEPSLTALEKAVEISAPNSYIFVFTDADSKEKNITENLHRLLRQRTPKVYFIVTGKCGRYFDPAYIEIATQSGGKFFHVNEGEVRTLLKTFEVSSQSPEYLAAPRTTFSNYYEPPAPVKINLHTESTKDTVYEFDTFSITCSSSSGELELRHNSQPLAEGVVIVSSSPSVGINELVLNVKQANANRHNGDYECVSSRQAGASSAIISVKGNKKIVVCVIEDMFSHSRALSMGW